jgi:hypothetical protein
MRDPLASGTIGMKVHRTSVGLNALALFFALGAASAIVSCVALLSSGGILEQLWILNPPAHTAFLALGPWAIVLMAVVGTACAFSAVGLWSRAPWGRHLALLLLVINLVGDVSNALIRGDLRTLIGLPIAGLLIAYLLSRQARLQFPVRKAAG